MTGHDIPPLVGNYICITEYLSVSATRHVTAPRIVRARTSCEKGSNFLNRICLMYNPCDRKPSSVLLMMIITTVRILHRTGRQLFRSWGGIAVPCRKMGKRFCVMKLGALSHDHESSLESRLVHTEPASSLSTGAQGFTPVQPTHQVSSVSKAALSRRHARTVQRLGLYQLLAGCILCIVQQRCNRETSSSGMPVPGR